jgi:hypothetical protein
VSACPARRSRLVSLAPLRTVAVCFALATACSKESASTKRDSSNATVAQRDTSRGSVASDAHAVIALVSAADWIGSEWSEDAIYSSHLPNVTGVYSPGFGDPEQETRIDLIRRTVPKARRVGILFSPDEPMPSR